MAVDREELEARINEAVDGDAELAAILKQKMLANDKIATSFMGGYMRNRDYTQKSQSLADDRRTYEGDKRTLEGQVEQYRQLLEAAEAEKANVLRQLADRDITVATANARLKHIKKTYQLSDEDIPSIPDQIETFQKGKPVDSTPDIDSKLAAFKADITKYISDKLVPELGGMAQLDIVWSDIRDEHRELTGKRLSAKEAQELLTEADKRGRAGRPISLKALWEEKYDAPALRTKKHDEELIKGERAKWEAEAAAKRSEEALAGIHPTPGAQEGLRTSQILNHKFQVHEELPAGAPKRTEVRSSSERQSLTGADRAARRYIERRAAGVPMGAPDERKPGGKAA